MIAEKGRRTPCEAAWQRAPKLLACDVTFFSRRAVRVTGLGDDFLIEERQRNTHTLTRIRTIPRVHTAAITQRTHTRSSHTHTHTHRDHFAVLAGAAADLLRPMARPVPAPAGAGGDGPTAILVSAPAPPTAAGGGGRASNACWASALRGPATMSGTPAAALSSSKYLRAGGGPAHT